MNENQAKERIRQMISFVQEEAKEKAREIESKTEHEYNNAKAKFLHEAKEKLTAEYDKKWKQLEIEKRIARSAAINAARMEVMKARHECMSSLLEEARFRVHERNASDQNGHRGVLTELIVEGLIKLLDTEVEVICRQDDVSLVSGVLGQAKGRYEEIMQRETGKNYTATLTVSSEEYLPPPPQRGSNMPSCCGGVVLRSLNGKIRCINTLDKRIEMAYENSVPHLRKIIF